MTDIEDFETKFYNDFCVAETTELLIKEETSEAAQAVLKSYNKLQNGRATVSGKFNPVPIIVAAIFAVGIGIVIWTYISLEIWKQIAIISVFYVIMLLACIGVITFAIVFSKRNYGVLYEVYYFQQGEKRIVFYINKKETLYYLNRQEVIQIDNKSKELKQNKWDKDIYFDLRLGFNFLVGDLSIKENKDGFYIWTPARYETVYGAGNYVVSGFASLTTDKEMNAKSIFISGSKFPSYKYRFSLEKDFKLTLPKELMEYCMEAGFTCPKENKWLSFE